MLSVWGRAAAVGFGEGASRSPRFLMKPLELSRLGKVLNNLLAAGGLHTLDEQRQQDNLAPVSEAIGSGRDWGINEWNQSEVVMNVKAACALAARPHTRKMINLAPQA